MRLIPVVKPLTAISSVLLYLGFLSSGFGQDIENLKKGVVKITAEVEGKRKLGTGFIVQKEEDAVYIVTASHVVEGARHIQVEFFTHRHRVFSAKVLGIEGGDPQGLAALLVVDKAPPGLAALPLGKTDDLSGGESAITIGFPWITDVPWAVIKGSIIGRKGQYIDVSMPLDEGSSGAPLIVEGQVIGIVTTVIGQYARVVPAIIARYTLDGWGIKVAVEPSPPEFPVAPKPKVGTLVVDAVPWARVYLNGEYIGLTPSRINDIPAGSHKLVLENPDYPKKIRVIIIEADQTARIKVDLR